MLEIYDSGEIFRLNEIYANAVAWHCLNKNGGFKMIDYPPNLAQKARDFYAQNNQMRDFELYKAQQITKIPLLNMSIYPARFFCPSWNFFGAKAIAPETISIHHNQSSWWAHKKPLRRILATRYKNPLKKFLFINTDKIAKICTFLIPNKKTRVKTRDKIKEFILNFVRI